MRSFKKKRGLGPEDIIHKQFANAIKSLESIKGLKCKFWTYFPSGEKRIASTGSLLKSKGLKPGVADYLFIRTDSNHIDHILWIEIKAPERESVSFDVNKNVMIRKKIKAGKQSDSQIAFENLFSRSRNSYYGVVHSVGDGLAMLESEGFIKSF